MSGLATLWRIGAGLVVLVALGALSFALHHRWLGGLFVTWAAVLVWARLLAAIVFSGKPPRIRSKQQRIRANIFASVFLAGMIALLNTLSPLWR